VVRVGLYNEWTMIFNEGSIEQPDLSFQVVIKLTDGFHLPEKQFEKEQEYGFADSIFTQRGLLELFPGISIKKVFSSVTPDQLKKFTERAKRIEVNYHPPDFFSYCSITCPASIDPDKLLKVLAKEKVIEDAYVENIPVCPPAINTGQEIIQRLSNYLLPAPVGINAIYAWNFDGGDGAGKIKFLDIEQGWLLNHERVLVKTLSSTGMNHYDFRDHGIAVLGIVMMQGGDGASGITPKTNGFVISQWRPDGLFNTADAIMAAINQLDYGDILLLEMQCFDSASSSQLWPIEIQEAVFQAIRLATALGITVIETAGNGDLNSRTGNDLDNFVLKGRKIFDSNSVEFRDSGAIIVGACSDELPHQRSYFSNYGNRVNCFAYGQNVSTAGYYPRSSGIAVNTYTNQFGGTSAAAAIVAGAAIAIQSISERNNEVRLSPQQMRSVLSNELYNTISANGKKDKIGVMPDLQKIIDNECSKTAKPTG